MATTRKLNTEQNDKLVPIVVSCMEMTQKNLEGLIRTAIRFSATRGHLVAMEDAEILKRPRHAYTIFAVTGDITGKIALFCPIPLATTLASLMLARSEDEIQKRRRATELTPDETDAFREIGNILGGGLDAAFRQSSSIGLRVQFEESGLATKWSPETVFTDAELVHFVTESKLGSFPAEEIHLVFSRPFLKEVTGMDLDDMQEERGGFEILAPEGRALMTLFGAALGVAEKKIIRTICDANSLDVHFNEDVRDLLYALVNFECAGMVMGDKSETQNARAPETNRAMLKRIRSHPKGKDLAVLCLAEWPDREHVLQMAQLGVRDIVGMPCKPDLLTIRLTAFVEGTLQRHARKVV